MTAQEMKYEFEVENELIGGLELPDLTDDEISIFLNIAQDKIVEELYKSSGTEFLTELLTILTNEATTSHAYLGVYDGLGYTWATMSEVMMFFVDGFTFLQRSAHPIITTNQWIKCDKIALKDVSLFGKTGFNTPWFKNPKMAFADNTVLIIPDNYTTFATGVNNFKITYIKRPVRIVVDTTTPANEEACELREFLHKDVVKRAVIELLDAYKSKMKEEGSKR